MYCFTVTRKPSSAGAATVVRAGALALCPCSFAFGHDLAAADLADGFAVAGKGAARSNKGQIAFYRKATCHVRSNGGMTEDHGARRLFLDETIQRQPIDVRGEFSQRGMIHIQHAVSGQVSRQSLRFMAEQNGGHVPAWARAF
jgi:hypothetical protein